MARRYSRIAAERQAREEARAEQLTKLHEQLSAGVAELVKGGRPVLIDIRTSRPLDADARHHYSGQALVDAFSALALLVESSPFGRMVGNVYLRIARPGIPTQLFTEERRALEWLIKHRV